MFGIPPLFFFFFFFSNSVCYSKQLSEAHACKTGAVGLSVLHSMGHSGFLLPWTQCYLKHCQPGPLQRFIWVHLDLSRVGERLQLRHPGTGFESALVERGGGGGGNNYGIFLVVVQIRLTSRVAKRACCWGLSGFTLTVWLLLNSCRSASLSHAWTAPWPAST